MILTSTNISDYNNNAYLIIRKIKKRKKSYV